MWEAHLGNFETFMSDVTRTIGELRNIHEWRNKRIWETVFSDLTAHLGNIREWCVSAFWNVISNKNNYVFLAKISKKSRKNVVHFVLPKLLCCLKTLLLICSQTVVNYTFIAPSTQSQKVWSHERLKTNLLQNVLRNFKKILRESLLKIPKKGRGGKGKCQKTKEFLGNLTFFLGNVH